ncbi:MAG: ABC transporter permease subunit [Hyphomicrobiales bacterium]|nr:ABC transporter permease subunit [Hyphomicrobiales bacterium]MDE2284152.1 ABC transporter permease subunit [Hyphomicrobiales bacterium]
MTNSAVALPRANWRPTAWVGEHAPIFTVVAVLFVVWYLAAFLMNAPQVRDAFARNDVKYTFSELVAGTMEAKRPVVPAPHQVAIELYDSIFGYPLNSPRNLAYHAWVTLSATVVGFAIGAIFGILLAILIVHLRTLEKSLLPWIICSQMVPILAIAPIIIVVFGAIGIRGLFPKSIISAYLCFFPVAIGMVKGLTSPDPIQLDLMRTWSANKLQVLRKLRWPASIPFLFASLKVSVTISLVGAIVAELPTGAQAGIGARLLSGSYYGQTVQIWAALVCAAVIATVLIAMIDAIAKLTARHMGAAT